MPGVPLSFLIKLAYNVKDFQLQGGPAWAYSDRYEVTAKAESPATFEQMRPMLQSLLAERFKLVIRRETRNLPLYELTPAKGGLNLEIAKEGSCVTIDPDSPYPTGARICGPRMGFFKNGESIEGFGISMQTLIDDLSDSLARTVVDKTGFTEKFNVNLRWADTLNASPLPPDDSGLPSLFEALGTVGLRLESTNGPVEVLVIDHAGRPSEN